MTPAGGTGPTLLVRNADVLVTMDGERREIRGADLAGGLHDPVAALVLCAPQRASWVAVNGRVVVEEGRIATVDMGLVLERHNRLARELVGG